LCDTTQLDRNVNAGIANANHDHNLVIEASARLGILVGMSLQESKLNLKNIYPWVLHA
jgi:O-antigen ligase